MYCSSLVCSSILTLAGVIARKNKTCPSRRIAPTMYCFLSSADGERLSSHSMRREKIENAPRAGLAPGLFFYYNVEDPNFVTSAGAHTRGERKGPAISWFACKARGRAIVRDLFLCSPRAQRFRLARGCPKCSDTIRDPNPTPRRPRTKYKHRVHALIKNTPNSNIEYNKSVTQEVVGRGRPLSTPGST